MVVVVLQLSETYRMMMMMVIIIIVIMMMMMVIIIIAFKDAIRDFVQSPHCAGNCHQHVRSSGPGAIVCRSRATWDAEEVSL